MINTKDGYSKLTLDNTKVLLAGGGDKSLTDIASVTDYIVTANGTSKHYVRDWGSSTANMNSIAKGGQSSVGMINLQVYDNNATLILKYNVNPANETGWHHFINLSYQDGGGGTNAWITQITNTAGTNKLWIRSRNGGQIVDGTAWVSNWERIALFKHENTQVSGFTNNYYYKLFSVTYSSYNFCSIIFTYFGGYSALCTAYLKLRFVPTGANLSASSYKVIGVDGLLYITASENTFTIWGKQNGTNSKVGYKILEVQSEGLLLNDVFDTSKWQHFDINTTGQESLPENAVQIKGVPYSDGSGATGTWPINITGSASLPTRLAEFITSNNLSTSTYNGFGRINANSPFTYLHTSNGDCMTINTSHTNNTWAGQLATDYRTNNIAYRALNNGTWTQWAEMLSTKNTGLIFNPEANIQCDPRYSKFTKCAGGDDWNTEIKSTVGYRECRVVFLPEQTNKHLMIGLNSDLNTNASYTSIDYAWYIRNDGGLQMYENGTSINSISGHTTYAAGDEFIIEYSDGCVKYYHNGVLCRRVNRTYGTKLYLDSSFHSTSGSIYGLKFEEVHSPFNINRTANAVSWYSIQQYNSSDANPSYFDPNCATINYTNYSGWNPWIRCTGNDKGSWALGNYEANVHLVHIDKTNTTNTTNQLWNFLGDGTLKMVHNNQWLTNATLQLGRKDANAYTDKACVGVTDGNLHLDAYKGKAMYLNHYSNAGRIYFNGGSYYIQGGYYNGTSAYANRLKVYIETSDNTNVYRVIGQQTLNTGWVNKGLVLAVASRHSGVGIYTIHYGAEISNGYYAANNQSNTDSYYTFANVYCKIRYFGDTIDMTNTLIICHVKPASGNNPKSAVFTFFLHSRDGSSPRISILQDWGGPFELIENGATMSTIDTSVYGELKESTIMNESNSCTGNSATATKATQDSDGNPINTTYLKLTGGTLTGALYLNYNNNNKIQLRTDNEGGNIRIYAPDSYKFYTNNSGNQSNSYWEMDAYDGNLRFYTYSGGDSTHSSPIKTITFRASGGITTEDNIIANGVVTSLGDLGYITSPTASLSSYWCKIWDATITLRLHNNLGITFLFQSLYDCRYGIICMNIRLNGANGSGSYDFSAGLYKIAGNIPTSVLRLYYNNSTGYCELWGNVSVLYGVFNVSILKRCWRIGTDDTSFGTLYRTTFTSAQTLPSTTLVDCLDISTANSSNYINLVATNEIQFRNKPSSLQDIWFNWRWADLTFDDKINRYIFGNGNKGYAGITAEDLLINTGDATLKIYSGRITDSYTDGFICMQTSIDGTDGQSHAYPTLYGKRCAIALQPRGGTVYVGTTVTAANTYADTTNKLVVGGSINVTSGGITIGENTVIHSGNISSYADTSTKWVGTQAQYDAITNKDSNTFYFIIES